MGLDGPFPVLSQTKLFRRWHRGPDLALRFGARKMLKVQTISETAGPGAAAAL
jgi:hypothetical protein